MATATEWAEVTTLRSDRAKLVADSRKIVSDAQAAKRDMSEEENAKFNKLFDNVAALDDRINKLEKMMDSDEDEETETETETETDEERSLNRTQHTDRTRQRHDARDIDPSRSPRRPSRDAAKPKNKDEMRSMPGESKNQFENRKRRAAEEYFNDVAEYLLYGNAKLHNSRAIQADVDIIGGFVVLPEKISQLVLKAVDDLLFIRNLGTVMQLPDSRSMGIPTLDANPDDGDWTTEIAPINADSTMAFGKRQLTPQPLRKRILISERWLRMAFSTTFLSADQPAATGGNGSAMIVNRLAYAIARTMEKAYMTGNGVNRPLGLFTASSRGISTGRDIVTGSATTFTYDGLININFGLKTQYQSRAEWLFHRYAVRELMKLKDSNNRPILNISTIPNVPTTLLDHKVNMSELVPSTFTTGLYVGMLGDFSFYHIVDSQEMTVKQADQLYAETAQVGFFISAESDAMPVLEEAFIRIKTS